MKFWLKKSIESAEPAATFTVERHDDGLWLMVDDGHGGVRALAKFRSTKAVRRFWEVFNDRSKYMHAMGSLGI